MYKLEFKLGRESWRCHAVEIERHEIAFAYMTAIRLVKIALNMQELDFIPVGHGQYIVWGQGRCQGYMELKEHGQGTSEHVSGNGQ